MAVTRPATIITTVGQYIVVEIKEVTDIIVILRTFCSADMKNIIA